MNYFAERLFYVLCDLAATLGGPVPSADLAAYANCAPRTARKYASMLEREGLVQRSSPRGGWLPVGA
jgi:DNA-binding IscR family transcriptional regulator